MSHYRLTPEQMAALEDVWRRLNAQPDARNAGDDDAIARDVLDSWITGVLSSGGRIAPDGMRELYRDGQVLPMGTRARAFYDEAHEIVRHAEVSPGRDARWRMAGSSGGRRFALYTARFVFLVVVLFVLQRFVLCRTVETSIVAAGVIAAFWATYYLIVEWRRERRRDRRGG